MSTREDREAAMIAYNGPDSVNRPRHREWIERGGDDCGATVYEVAQAIANARAEGYARGQRAADERTAAAVERERERAESLLALGAALARHLGDITQNAISPMFAAEEAISDWDRFIAGETIRSRPPRAGAETTNATREARPRCTTCGDSGWSIDDESNRRRCSCAAAGRGEVERG